MSIFEDMGKSPEVIVGCVQPVWVAIANTDTNEGRGQSYVLAVSRHRELAKLAAKGKGVFGGDATLEERAALELKIVNQGREDTLYYIFEKDIYPGYNNESLEPLRQAALNKLTPEERTLLGLKA